MASQPVSAMTQFSPQGRFLIAVVDPQAGFGLKNGAVLVSSLISMLNETVAGSQIYSGVGEPSETLGNSGDYYIDSNTGLLYGPKQGVTWPDSPLALSNAAIIAETARAEAAEAALKQTALSYSLIFG